MRPGAGLCPASASQAVEDVRAEPAVGRQPRMFEVVGRVAGHPMRSITARDRRLCTYVKDTISANP